MNKNAGCCFDPEHGFSGLNCFVFFTNCGLLIETLFVRIEIIFNACTLVPTVFLQHLKTKFEIPFAFSVFLRFPKTKFKQSIFVFHFPTTLENGIPNSIFVFRRHRQLNFNFHFYCTSFYCFTKLMFQSVLWSFRSTARINIGTSFLREKAWKTMAIFWCE